MYDSVISGLARRRLTGRIGRGIIFNMRAIVLFITASLGAMALAQSAPGVNDPAPTDVRENTSDAHPNTTVPVGQDDDIYRLIRELGSSDFVTREAADDALREIGLPAIDQLAWTWQNTDDFEIRIRIQRIAERIFFWDRVVGENGFLGIQHRAYFPNAADPRVEPGKAAFEIQQVIPGTAAASAGLQANDLIVSLNGLKLDEGASPQDFAELIRHRKPGALLQVELYRGNRYIEINVKIGHRPLRHYGGAASPELNRQMQAAVGEFPEWWTSRFGELPASYRDLPSPEQPLFLNLPSEIPDR